jgi:hypothetical protein
MNASGTHASKSFVWFFFMFDFYGKKSNNNSWQNGGMW